MKPITSEQFKIWSDFESTERSVSAGDRLAMLDLRGLGNILTWNLGVPLANQIRK